MRNWLMGCFVIGFTTIYHIQSHQNPSIIMILALTIPKFTTKKAMKTSLASPWPTPQRLEGRLLPVPLSPVLRVMAWARCDMAQYGLTLISGLGK